MTFGPPAAPLLEPPFARENALCDAEPSPAPLVFPHAVRHDDRLLRPHEDMRLFLQHELATPKLNALYRWLWLAGLPRPARPLHRQRLLMRTIILTEKPDEHLVWRDGCIFVKPLPDYLCDHAFWAEQLVLDEGLHRSACGLLLSYAWLVAHRSDLAVAHEVGLLPRSIGYEQWTRFAADVVSHVDQSSLAGVDRRYHYGELRLSRLNSMYRLGMAGLGVRRLVFGFMSGSTRYNTFFSRNFGWIFIIFIYMSIVLSALQVALSITDLGEDSRFQDFSYGVVMVSMGFVATAVGLVSVVWWTLFWFHLVSTIRYTRMVGSQRASSQRNSFG